ncbi:hypothetical protein PR202_gb28198 [Eleusine coracana subsp. coracana]|uniref:Uncharacterized protein n=1 Tax=Eleusine coracana subsp. coracana TaxID=191504 RepID=A0AAV5FVR7_ELECO|nr:hypothetical protein PR202_gb28198 [Eleusine coracana subsp. coracana]
MTEHASDSLQKQQSVFLEQSSSRCARVVSPESSSSMGEATASADLPLLRVCRFSQKDMKLDRIRAFIISKYSGLPNQAHIVEERYLVIWYIWGLWTYASSSLRLGPPQRWQRLGGIDNDVHLQIDDRGDVVRGQQARRQREDDAPLDLRLPRLRPPSAIPSACRLARRLAFDRLLLDLRLRRLRREEDATLDLHLPCLRPPAAMRRSSFASPASVRPARVASPDAPPPTACPRPPPAGEKGAAGVDRVGWWVWIELAVKNHAAGGGGTARASASRRYTAAANITTDTTELVAILMYVDALRHPILQQQGTHPDEPEERMFCSE